MKRDKLLKVSISILLLCVLLGLTACHTSTGITSGDNESQESEGDISKNEPEQQGPSGEKEQGETSEEAPTGDFGYRLSSVVNAMTITEKGYYFIANEILYFYDTASEMSLPMCSRTECNHSDATCDAYISHIHEGTGQSSFLCDREELFYYNDKLYMVECNEDGEYYLCRYSSTYNDKERVVMLASYKKDGTYASDRGAYTILDGYFYYYTFVFDVLAQLKGEYTIELNCMRVKMAKGAVPEKLGSFEYAGDVTLTPLGCEGITVLTNGENIYYVAGHSTRMFTAKNPMEYILAKYTVSTKEFAILDSYTGARSRDVWGEEIGLIHCNTNRVCMADDGTMYINTRDGIVAINLETNARTRIYTSPYIDESVYKSNDPYSADTLVNLAYDGKYLYFLETEVKVGTYLTVIDTEGNLIRRYKFEYLATYEKKLEELASTSSKPETIYLATGGLVLLGVTDEHIVVASNTTIYKNLAYSVHESPEANIIYGVGLINTSDLLENKEIQIKQIYQY